MAKKKMTIEDLAVLTQKGFLEVGASILCVKIELKSDIAEVRDELKSDILGVKTELKSDIFETKVRIDKLEDQMRELVSHIDALVAFMKKEEQERVFLIA